MPRRLFTLGLLAVLTFPSASARAEWVVASGRAVRIGFYYAVDPTCASLGEATIGVVQPPVGGRLEVRRNREFPNFPTSNARAHCDTRKVPVTEVIYRSAPGFTGHDQAAFEVIYPRGQQRVYRAFISVR